MTPPRRPLGHGRAAPTTDPGARSDDPTAGPPTLAPTAAAPTAAPDGPATAQATPEPDPALASAENRPGDDERPAGGAVPHSRAAVPPEDTATPYTTSPPTTDADDADAADRGDGPAAWDESEEDVPGHDPEPGVVPGGGVVDILDGTSQAEPVVSEVASQVPAEPGPPLAAALEAILLVADQPIPEVNLAQILERPQREITAALHALAAEYTAAGRGFDLREVAGGWRYYTRASCSSVVERYVTDGQNARLTQAALETLAVVAYRQPVSRARVSAIRGVNCDGVMRTLLTRGLVEEAGTERESGALLYRTTGYFLERMGLRSLDELPEIAPYLPEGATLEEIEAVEGAP